jgi:hypothetical protein
MQLRGGAYHSPSSTAEVTQVGMEMFTFVKDTSIYVYRSRDSVVGIATGYGLDDGGVGVRVPVT